MAVIPKGLISTNTSDLDSRKPKRALLSPDGVDSRIEYISVDKDFLAISLKDKGKDICDGGLSRHVG